MMSRRRSTLVGGAVGLVAIGAAGVALSSGNGMSGARDAASAVGAIDDFAATSPFRIVPYTPPEASTRIAAVTRGGVSGPVDGVEVATLAVTPGRYVVEYGFEVRFESAYAPTTLECGITGARPIDSSGIDSDAPDLVFSTDDAPIESAPTQSGPAWVWHSFEVPLDLDDATLGIRCSPAEVGLYSMAFRNLDFSATRLPDDG